MSLFNIWIDTPITSGDQNVISHDTLEEDAQRTRGFKAGEAASALRVNTMLRQSSLVIKALADIMGGDSLSITSTSQEVKDVFDNYLNNFATKTITNTLTGDISTVENNLDTLIEELDNGTKVVNKATNSTNSTNATYATYASNDTSKGTIEERLTSLGFKSGTVSATQKPVGTIINDDSVNRQGNYCILNFDAVYPDNFIQHYKTDPIKLIIPNNFLVKDYTLLKGFCYVTYYNSDYVTTTERFFYTTYTLKYDNEIDILVPDGVITDSDNYIYIHSIQLLNFGYEAKPLS